MKEELSRLRAFYNSGEVREELGSAFGGLGGALRFRPQLLLRRCPRVAPRAPHERLADGEGGLSHALAPDRAVLREGGPLDEGERKIEAFYSSGSLLHGG